MSDGISGEKQQRQAVAQSLLDHYLTTGHTRATEVPTGWTCWECGEARFLSDPMEGQ